MKCSYKMQEEERRWGCRRPNTSLMEVNGSENSESKDSFSTLINPDFYIPDQIILFVTFIRTPQHLRIYFGKCYHKPQSPRHQPGSTKKLQAYALRYPSSVPTGLGSLQRFAAGKEVLMVASLLYDGRTVSTSRPKI